MRTAHQQSNPVAQASRLCFEKDNMTDLKDRALERISSLVGHPIIDQCWKYFQKIQQMLGGDKIFRRIVDCRDGEDIKDYLAEIRYSLVFAGLGFQVEIEPLGGTGPDVKITRDGNNALVEIMRFRKIYPGPPMLDKTLNGNLELMDYGNPVRDIQKCYEKILLKFKQIRHNDLIAIIAIWNDDGDLEEIECKEAVHRIQSDSNKGNISVPTNLSFILYGSNAQLYCFPICTQKHFLREWQKELNQTIVNRVI